jgi:hypothetical protein
MADNFTDTRQKLLMRWGQMKTERSSWWSHWQEISNYLIPWGGRFFRQDRDKGGRRANLIYDNTGSRALKTLGAGPDGGRDLAGAAVVSPGHARSGSEQRGAGEAVAGRCGRAHAHRLSEVEHLPRAAPDL